MATTYSAGTYSAKICVVCHASGDTFEEIFVGSLQDTIREVEPEHPSYTNGAGDEVIQIQMVTLGGYNGLNN